MGDVLQTDIVIRKVGQGLRQSFIDRSGTPGDPHNVPDFSGGAMGTFFQVVVGVVVVFIGVGLYMVVKVGAMSDSERETVGHGPKGQGR